MKQSEQQITLHPGSDIELTMHITTDQKGGLFIRADLSGEEAADGESRIGRGKYRAFSNAIHSAVYAAPKQGIRIKPSYSIATNDQTGEVTCSIPEMGAAEAIAVLHYLSAPVRTVALHG